MLATDGNPTGRKNGSQYSPNDWRNTLNSDGLTWTYGPAVRDVFTELTSLRSTVKDSHTYDIQTYVIGMGDILLNPGSVAALNEMANKGGTGKAYLASDKTAMVTAFQSVVDAIAAKTGGAASAVSFSSQALDSGTHLYQTKFESAGLVGGHAVGWTGSLLAYPVGGGGSLGAAPTWDAGDKLQLQNWDTGRAIVTYKPSAALGLRGVAFRWPANPGAPTSTEFDLAQVAALNADGHGALRLNYLRGDAAKEERNCGACTPNFRNRLTNPIGHPRVLGDIINSAPTYVAAPSSGYADSIESVTYSSFAAARKTRAPMVYVGANDGMLHGFDAATGDEKLAYVPALVTSSLTALSTSPYSHQYTVDGTPMVNDAFYGGAWHTLLVAGLRVGGKGLYALDVTDPANFKESSAGSVARWEVDGSDGDMGLIFGKPMIVKTNNGKWSVIVGNGYNSANEHAVLYVLDAETGAVTKKIDTGAAPSNGLSGVAPIDVDRDGVIDVVYAGDLRGNLWKFDLSSSTASSWGVSIGGAALFAAGSTKPITGRPDVVKDMANGGYVVTFGTGQYLSTTDLSSVTTQSIYGIWDKDNTAVVSSQLQQQVIDTATKERGGTTYRVSSHRVGTPKDSAIASDLPTITSSSYVATKRGWYIDLPTPGERVVTDSAIRNGHVIFSSMIPDPAVCKAGGTGWVLEFDVFNGNRGDSVIYDTNDDGNIDDADLLDSVITNGWATSGLPSDPAFLRLGSLGSSSSKDKACVNTSDGNVECEDRQGATATTRRLMWRVIK